jgi:hypothetical protein
MSFQITESFVQEFGGNVYMLSQQRGSKLRPSVRQETIHGKARAFDRIGAVDMQTKAGRHSNTPQMDTPHSRRWCYLVDKEWADLIDDLDKVRVLNDPTSEYVMAAMWSAGREMDKAIIASADATVTTGEDQGGTAILPDFQKFAANASGAFTNLKVATLISVKNKFGLADVDDEIPLHIAVTQSQISGLLTENQVTSADYNQIKALVKGEIDTFMGFQFHRLSTKVIPVDASAQVASVTTGEFGTGSAVTGFRKCVAWAQDGLILGIGADMKAKISERDDKSYATQAYVSMAIGAVRMEEEKVVSVYCKES